MRLPEHAVRRPVLTTMVFLGLLLLGAVSFTRLEVDLLPPLDFPSLSIVTAYEGAGPEEIETLITRPVEQALATIEGIDRIESFSAEGRSRVALRFLWGTNLDAALNDVRAGVERIRGNFPEDADDPVVFKFNTSSFPVLYLGLSGTLDEPALRRLAELQLGPRLERIEGVARVDVRGGLRREIRVLLEPARLRALQLPAAEVVAALRAQNVDLPIGRVFSGDDNLLVRSMGQASVPEDLLEIVVGTRVDADGQSRPVLLADVARVVDTFEEPTNVVHIDGESGVRVDVTKQSGANTVAVAERARDEIARINEDFAGRARLFIVDDTSEYIEQSIHGVQEAVLVGAVLAVLVLLFFLRSLAPTLVIATAIPISIIGMFTLMYAFDITLNLVSFGGVALGIGLLVDSAIVILENIFQKHEEGLEPVPAATEGAREVAAAIVASTLTTVVVFVPVVFLTGFAAIFFGQMAFVVSFALVCSLAVALTLVPMLASRFLKGPPRDNALTLPVGRLLLGVDAVYHLIVRTSLRHRTLTLLVALAALGGSLTLVDDLGSELLTEDDQSEVRIFVELPVGTRLAVTERAIRPVEARIAELVPELVGMQVVVGTPGFYSTAGEERATFELKLTRPGQRSRSSDDIAKALRAELPALVPRASVRAMAGGGLWILRVLRGGGDRLEVQVRGEELATADRLAAEVQTAMVAVDGVSSAKISREPGGRELRVLPDRRRLAALGVDPALLGQQLQTWVQGTRATVLRSDGDEFEVRVKLADAWREGGPEALLDLPVFLPGRGATTLRDVAHVEEAAGPLVIERHNQSRVVQVSATLTGDRDLGSITQELREGLRRLDVPDNFSVIVRGETEEQEKTFAALRIGVLLSILLVFMVMAGQFESFLHPLYIMLSIPFAAIGVVLALYLTDTTFNMQSFMGCIVLVGIVVNNAIVLVDYINLLRRERGLSVREAVVTGCRRRLRPVLITTATTLLALLPVAVGLGEGAETQAPLARAVIGGLTVSSAISLVVIPVIYDAVEGWLERRTV